MAKIILSLHTRALMSDEKSKALAAALGRPDNYLS